MGQLRLEGDPPIIIKLRRNAGSRRLSLRVSRLDGGVTISMPRWTRSREALKFAQEKEDWIRRQLDRQHERIAVEIGGMIHFRGEVVPIIAADGRVARFEGGSILVPGASERAGAKVAAFMKTRARQQLAEASDLHGARLGRRHAKLTLRDTRSRWGSCSSDGNLMFSWRLIMAPPEVLDYVAAHEVAHLCEMNHSPAFWDLVEGLCPDYRAPRKWLRENGALLHAYRFAI